MKKVLTLLALLMPQAAMAICPVCTVAIGAGLTILEAWGVDLLLIGIWAGALTLVMVFWTAKWLNRKNAATFWYALDFVLWYGVLFSMYLYPSIIQFGANSLFGIDKLLLGIIFGSVVIYAAEKLNARLVRNNGGKSYFKFQKVVVPVGALSIVTFLAWLLLEVA